MQFTVSTPADALMIALIFATLAHAWSWLGSYAGVISFGHAVPFGIGAYAVAISHYRGGSPWYGALAGALCAVALAAVCGVLLLHGRGYAFTALTLVAGLAAAPFVAARGWLGSGSAFVFPLHPGFFNLQFTSVWPYLLLAAAVFAVTQGLTFGLRATPLSYGLRALRTNPAAARSVGIAARPLQLPALAASAFVTSVAGSLYAEYLRGVDPHVVFAAGLSFDIALVGVVAGPRWVWAAPAAAAVYAVTATLVPLHPPGAAGVAVLVAEAAAIVLIARLRPEGLFVAPEGALRRAAVRSGA